MEINLVIYGGAVAIGALAAVTVQWVYNEWLWRLSQDTEGPELSDALLQKATMAALLEMIDLKRDRSEGLAPDYEEPDVIS